MTITSTAKTAFLWPVRQVTGFFRGLWTFFVDDFGPSTALGPSIRGSVLWFWSRILAAFGFGSPGNQLVSSVVLGVVAFLSSTITFGATLVLVALFTFTAGVGLVRFVPVVNAFWPLPERAPAILAIGRE